MTEESSRHVVEMLHVHREYDTPPFLGLFFGWRHQIGGKCAYSRDAVLLLLLYRMYRLINLVRCCRLLLLSDHYSINMLIILLFVCVFVADSHISVTEKLR